MLGSGYMGDGNTEKTNETMRQIRKWRQTGYHHQPGGTNDWVTFLNPEDWHSWKEETVSVQ